MGKWNFNLSNKFNVMNIINIINAVIVSVGFCLTIFSKDTDKRRYIGWLMIATTVTIVGISKIIDGIIGSALVNFGIGLVDYWLAYYWYGKYKEEADAKEILKLDDKERLLKEIMRFRK